VNQSLPFIRFSNEDWEALVDVRNLFRDGDASRRFTTKRSPFARPSASSADCW